MVENSPKTPGRILIVDDEEHIRRILSLMLSSEGYEVAEAGDGASALELFASEVFDLVILDLRMPDMDGIEVLTRLRAQTPSRPWS